MQKPKTSNHKTRIAISPLEIDFAFDLFLQGKYLEATSFARSLTVRAPMFGFGWKILGAALVRLGSHQQALEPMQRAASLLPSDPEAQFNLGVVLKSLGKTAEAVPCYLRAINLQPDRADAHYNLGNAFAELLRPEEARASYEEALRIKPDFLLASSNLVCLNNYFPEISAATQLDDARRYGELVSRLARPFKSWDCAFESNKCLNVGLVSGDLREHPVGFFLVGILESLTARNDNNVKFHAYLSNEVNDQIAARIKICCQSWNPITALSDEQAAKKIHDDKIDILIDLSGHTEHNRLPVFAWKPAPIQLSWLGYFGTTGVNEIDYVLADPWTLPEEISSHFSEKIWCLPDTRLCFTPPDIDIFPSPLPALSSKGDTPIITFGCFSTPRKINNKVIELWSRILNAIPNSVLLLKSAELEIAPTKEKLLASLKTFGASLERIRFEGHEARNDYLKAYSRIDITLDTFPFPGGTTSVESLWMGVPVLSMTGESFISRQGVGLLTNAGLQDWIARDADSYFEKAIFHTRDLNKLSELRTQLRQRVVNSPLFDLALFAENFKLTLNAIWAKKCLALADYN